MTAVNHALTGTLIGLATGQPLIALPAALASHFVCDALPHYGSLLPDEVLLKTKGYQRYLMAEAAICFGIVLTLAILQPVYWLLAAICAFVAASPDLLSIDRYIKTRRGQSWRAKGYFKFAIGIQWFGRPIGAVVEVTWLIAMIILIVQFLRY